MEITILHGEDLVSSRARFEEIISKVKEKGWEVRPLGDKSQGESLFSTDILFTSEDISKINFKKLPRIDSLLIWNDGEIAKTKLPAGAKSEKFDLPKKLFALLESIGSKNSFALSHEEPKELVFAMIGRQIRDMYWVKIDEKTLIYPDWRISKLKSQANRFTTEKLRDLITLLSKLDLDAKTGVTTLPVALDLVLAGAIE